MCPRSIRKRRLAQHHRKYGVEGFPEVSEIEVIRHFTRLSTWNYAIDLGMYPLGSCTMKYNPRVNEFVARLDGIATEHPYQPQELSQGCLKILQLLEKCLLEITGMDAITLQPAAGAQGELTGLLLIRAYLEKQGNPRKKVLIPDSAHGTNPATAVIAGYEVENIKSESPTARSMSSICASRSPTTSRRLMLTNPSTLGIFEQRIPEIADILARQRRAALYGRREHERAGRRHAAGRSRRGRDAPESAQDFFHAARRRRARRGAGGDEENSRAIPPCAGAGGKRRRKLALDSIATTPSAA